MTKTDLSDLRRAVAALEPAAASKATGAAGPFGLGFPALDAWLGGGLARGVLHEVHAGSGADTAAASGFGLGLAMRASMRGAEDRPLVWMRQDFADAEAGGLYGEGVAALGLDPRRLIVVRARDPTGILRAAGEAARCRALGAALIEIWGEARGLDLTASRRLAMAAAVSGVTLVMIRLSAKLSAKPAPSAATSRWGIAAAVSTPLEAEAPGRPAYAATLLRHRAGLGPRTWHLEWDRDSLSFAEPPLSRPVVSVPAGRAGAAQAGPGRPTHLAEAGARRRAG